MTNNTIFYLITINILSFIVTSVDKYLAIKKKSRVSEKSLFILAIAAGSIGTLLSMYIFRHKTKKLKFKIGIPIILIIQIIILMKILGIF